MGMRAARSFETCLAAANASCSKLRCALWHRRWVSLCRADARSRAPRLCSGELLRPSWGEQGVGPLVLGGQGSEEGARGLRARASSSGCLLSETVVALDALVLQGALVPTFVQKFYIEAHSLQQRASSKALQALEVVL